MQAGDIVTINSRKYDGTIRRSWTCRFVEQKETLLVFEGVFDANVSHPDLGLIAAGTRSFEYYWLDRWYNVFRFFEPTGEFRNFYCNINMPPTFENGVLDYVDLDIDVLVWPDGQIKVLDEDDFEVNAAGFEYSDELKSTVQTTLDKILKVIETGAFPFAKSGGKASGDSRHRSRKGKPFRSS